MRKPFVAGNWKLNKSPDEGVALVKELAGLLSGHAGVEVAVAPPFVTIPAVAPVARKAGIGVAGQNCYWEESGAFTGEVSPGMLKAAGCTHVIIGHSERRQYFGETNETVNRRLKAALAAGLAPIVCCGETLAEREGGLKEKVVEAHVRGGLAGLSPEDMKLVTIAYEPVWAIGTGVNATPGQAQEMHAFIRKLLSQLFGKGTANVVRIQYGGSVKPDNAAELLGQPDVDGALVGGASLKADSFAAIVKAAPKEA